MNELPVLAHLAVLLVRPGVVVALAPTFGGLFAPARTKVGLTVMLAIALMPSVAVPRKPRITPSASARVRSTSTRRRATRASRSARTATS